MSGRQVNVYFREELYNVVRNLVGARKISQYINQAVEEKILREKSKNEKEFQEKLIRGYQAIVRNKKIQKELAIWDKTLTDSDNNEGK